MTGHERCHETVNPATREERLEAYGHRCQGCGRCSPEAGGLATLHVHHLTRDPEGMDEHDPANLTVLCRSCHSWQHQQASEADVPVEITDEDLTVLLPQDIEILQILAGSGPATTGDVAGALSTDLTVTAVRERLWVLMGLDNLVTSRDRQVIDQDVDTGEWGLAGQIEHSSRGRIPSDPQMLWQRIEDELVRQALDRGCDRTAVTDILDMSRRSTFYKEKRGRAYDFPLDAIHRRGGRPAADADADEQGGVSRASDEAESSSGAQQRFDTGGDRQQRTATDGGDDGEGDEAADSDGRGVPVSVTPEGEWTETQECVQQAIAALKQVDETL
ncbi:HNH endonuclease [Halosolutus gelatinilyticus]|uniref:HNH endonuclease n=1 Tax=Halosolutus gelatinilyticus TaxID=2931975 RepID=UPI001FF5969C|nr:HNH endonuclease signature motif containing protein [Halosolutus gelatinilyticus]